MYMDWEYLRRKNEDELNRLNLPKVGGKVKVLVFDKYTPYKVDIFPDMKIFPIEEKYGMHGTFAAQIIKIIYDNVELHGCGYVSDINKIIDYAIDNDIKIISASINFSYSKEKEKTLQKYYEWGGIFVTSAGNDDDREVRYPGSSKYTIAVSATNTEDCNGPAITITSDSLWFVRNKKPGYYHVFNGTSASAPVIAGCVCYIIDRYPHWNLDDVIRFLQENSTEEMKSLEEYEKFFSFPKNWGDKVNKPEKIIIHHSLTDDNEVLKDFDAIRRYHMNKGWRNIGYHWVLEKFDGKYHWIQGRDEKEVGAHCKEQGMNYKSIGICVVGDFDKQELSTEIYKLVAKKCKELIKKYNLSIDDIEPHRKYAPYKSCPGTKFDIEKVKKYMRETFVGKQVDREIPIVLDGKELDARAIVIEMEDGGYSFGEIRKVFEELGFTVGYDGRVILNSPKGWNHG